MNTDYYSYIVGKLIELKNIGYLSAIDIQEGLVDYQLDMLIRALCYSSEFIDNKIDGLYDKMCFNVLSALHPYLFNYIPSKAIIKLQSTPTAMIENVAKGTEIKIFDKNQSFTFSVLSDTCVTAMTILKSMYVTCDDIAINNKNGNYFISIKFSIPDSVNINDLNNKEISFFINNQSFNMILSSIMNANIHDVFAKENKTLVKIGTISWFDICDINATDEKISTHIQALLAFFLFRESMHYFKIKFEFSSFLNNTIDIKVGGEKTFVFYIPVATYEKKEDFIFVNCVNIINLYKQRANMFKFSHGLEVETYIDYVSRDEIIINSISCLYAIKIKDNKKYSIPNCYTQVYDIDYDVLQLSYIFTKTYDKFKTFIALNGYNINNNIDINEYNYYYTCFCFNVINRKVNILKCLSAKYSFIVCDNIIFGVTQTKKPQTDNYTVLSNLFILNRINITNTDCIRTRILNVLNPLAYLYEYHEIDFNIFIIDITITDKFKEVIYQNRYISNIIYYELNIIISDAFINLDIILAYCLSQFIFGLFNINILCKISFITNMSHRIVFSITNESILKC